jgi:hypothetical protein
MRHSKNRKVTHQREDDPCIDLRGFEKELPEGLAEPGRDLGEGKPMLFQDFADEGKAIGMGTAGSKPDDPGAHPNCGSVNDLPAFHNTYRKPGKVVSILPVDTGHLRGLPAQKRHPCFFAPFHNPLHKLNPLFEVEPGKSHVIKEEKGFRPVDKKVVGAHGDKILPDPLEIPSLLRQKELGTDPIGCGEQNGILIPAEVEGKESGKPADLGQNPFAVGSLDKRADPVDEFVPLVNIYTCLGVSTFRLLFKGGFLHKNFSFLLKQGGSSEDPVIFGKFGER